MRELRIYSKNHCEYENDLVIATVFYNGFEAYIKPTACKDYLTDIYRRLIR